MFNIKFFLFTVFLFLLNFFTVNTSKSQFDSHPELDWFTIETKHFYINYHSGTERTANTVAKIAEEIYGPITSLYKYEPDEKVNFIINDVSDIANGATDYYGNRIEIFATALDYDLRGTHNWLRNVVTHEFTHAVQIQCAMKYSRKMPAIYFQWLGYENEIRPDVLYGYPNIIVSYPLSGVGVPAWFAEGTSQYQRQQLSYEQWDSHRDMILRSYIEDGNLLSWGEMGQFSSITSLKAESIYNLGYGLTRYIAWKYGEDKLRLITLHLGDLGTFSMDKAIKDAIGIDGKELYNQWVSFLKKDYESKLVNVKKDSVVGSIIEKTGFANYNPQFSPDGKKITYLSNQDFDYGSTGMYIYDIAKKEAEYVTAPVSTNYSWSPDGKKIIFAKRNTPQTIHHSTVYDLYEYNVKAKIEKRLTTNLRAYSPSYSPDGKLICFVVNKDGTLNLEIADADGTNYDPITAFNNGEQVYNPKFSKDGKKIIFDFSFEESRKLAEIEIETGKINYLLDDPGVDYRNPSYSIDGKKLYFSSNRTGIFNIYSMDLENNDVKQLTNVLGGAFMPSVDTSGNLAYSLYTSTGYKIALLKDFKEKDTLIVGSYQRPEPLIKKYADFDTLKKAGSDYDWLKLKNFNDKGITKYEAKPYKDKFTSLSFVPVLRFDTYKRQNQFSFFEAIKPGVYFFSNEVLNRFSIFGGASINIEGERDVFLQFDYDNGFPFFKDFFTKKVKFNPKLSLGGYNVTRVSQGSFIAGLDTINVGITYDLLTFDFGMAFNIINFNHRMNLGYSYSNYSYDVDPFAIPQSGISVRSSRETYFKASDFSLQYNYNFTYPSKNSDINPLGRNIELLFDYELSEINPSLSVNDNGTISTDYEQRDLFKFYGYWSEAIGLFNNKHSLTLRLSGGTIFGPPVESFYDFYATGLPGMKGYPFYSLGGGRMAVANLTYRIPVFTKIDTRISPLYLDKLFFSVYGDYGNAWSGNATKLDQFKTDIGAQLRLQAFSFYVFPTSFFVDAAYGFDEFSNVVQNEKLTYGKEWNFYLGILFGFDL
ncbi:MAG TPA: biopolymer transporter Tol [Ignavibacteria bacterium]|mgnify:CR=1 FL=1|nr:biopolymer transporter Tol [Ignavibacteria bacterium]